MKYYPAILGFMLALVTGASAGTLDDVRARDQLICGVSQGLRGFSEQDQVGTWRGFDVDFCKAVAAVVLGDTNKVTYIPLTAGQRFEILIGGDIDLLSRNSTWNMSRDIGATELAVGLEFAGVSYFDGQSFLVPSLYGVTSAYQLEGATICVVGGTTSEQNAANYFSRAGVQVNFLRFDERPLARQAYDDGDCDTYTGDRSALAAERSLLDQPDAHGLLRDIVSKEPLGPVTRQGDAQWSDLVRWTLFSLINAEELELSAADVEHLAEVGQPATVAFDLDPNWLANVLGSVGNYGDIYERNLGEDTPLALGRGLNALWTRGGLLYAPPMQ